MARKWDTGFELQTTTNGVEWDTTTSGGGGSVLVDTTHQRSGAACLKIVSSVSNSNYIEHQVFSSNTACYTRMYMNFSAFPSDVLGAILQANDSVGTVVACIAITTAGKLRLFDGNSSGTQLGSDSSALSTGTWYMIELKVVQSASPKVEARLNAVAFASGTPTDTNNPTQFDYGMPDFVTGMTAYMDDVAVNDTTGSFQTGYPGSGKIKRQSPNAAGDNNAWLVAVGGTAGSANNYTRVNETTPDNATSYNADTVSGHIDDYAVSASGIGVNDTVNCVSIGVVYAGASSSSDATFKVRLKALSGGTVVEGTAITPNSTSWKTNANAVPKVYTLVSYQKPGTSNAWTQADLDAAQIGLDLTTTGTNACRVTVLWMSVDYTPAAGGAAPIGKDIQAGQNTLGAVIMQAVNRASTY